MKRIVLALAVVALGACQKAEQKPAAQGQMTSDTSHMMMSDTSKMMMTMTADFSNVAGTWEGKSMVGPKDSVFTTWVLTATADGKGWTYKRPNVDPYPVRVVATGGDSIVTEMGPLPSTLRPGQTVTMVRTVGHYAGSKMTGTFEARYASGDVVRGKVAATKPAPMKKP